MPKGIRTKKTIKPLPITLSESELEARLQKAFSEGHESACKVPMSEEAKQESVPYHTINELAYKRGQYDSAKEGHQTFVLNFYARY